MSKPTYGDFGSQENLLKAQTEKPMLDRYRGYVESGGKTPYNEWYSFGAHPDYGTQLAHLRDISSGPTPELAPQEYEQFTRDWVKQNPMTGPATMAIFNPAYQALKAVGWRNDSKTTSPSLAQLSAGSNGIWKGVVDNYMKK
jgi:hypothetical protein